MIKKTPSPDEESIYHIFKRYLDSIEFARSINDLFDFIAFNATAEHKDRVEKKRAGFAALTEQDRRLTLVMQRTIPQFSELDLSVTTDGSHTTLHVSSGEWKGRMEFRKIDKAWKIDSFLEWDEMPQE